jgi:hypothetical protein
MTLFPSNLYRIQTHNHRECTTAETFFPSYLELNQWHLENLTDATMPRVQVYPDQHIHNNGA